MLVLVDGATPTPVSATVITTPFVLDRHSVASRVRTCKLPPLPDIASIALRTKLLITWRISLSRQTIDSGHGVSSVDHNAALGKFAFVEIEDGGDQVGGAYRLRFCRLSIEP
jgi:hypothetical protein